MRIKQLTQFRKSQLSPLSKKMDVALEQVSKDEKLDLILDKAVVLISNKAYGLYRQGASQIRPIRTT